MSKKTIYTEDTLAKMGLIRNPDGSYSKAKTVPQPREIVKKTLIKKEVEKRETSNLEELKFQWQGKDISLNAWYSSKHWTHRDKQKKDWHSFFKQMIEHPYPYFEKYSISLEFNSRLDPSNTITMVKLLEDTLQELGVISGDDLKYCSGVHLIPNKTMKKKSYKIVVKNESRMA